MRSGKGRRRVPRDCPGDGFRVPSGKPVHLWAILEGQGHLTQPRRLLSGSFPALCPDDSEAGRSAPWGQTRDRLETGKE